MLIKHKIASILLKLFATCDLTFALESRKDVCNTYYVVPYGDFTIDAAIGDGHRIGQNSQGPAVILVVID